MKGVGRSLQDNAVTTAYIIRCWIFFKCITKNHNKRGTLWARKDFIVLHIAQTQSQLLKIKLYTSSIVAKHTNINFLWYIDLQYKVICFPVQCIFYLFLRFCLFLHKLVFFLCKLQNSRNIYSRRTVTSTISPINWFKYILLLLSLPHRFYMYCYL